MNQLELVDVIDTNFISHGPRGMALPRPEKIKTESLFCKDIDDAPLYREYPQHHIDIGGVDFVAQDTSKREMAPSVHTQGYTTAAMTV